jgi:hypothetical protein
MRLLRLNTLLLAAGLFVWALPTGLFAQDQDPNSQGKGKTASITGCLTKEASGSFVLTDEATGTKTMVTGASDLHKHASNHKVTLTGKMSTDSSGKPVFEASKIQQVSTTCKPPAL